MTDDPKKLPEESTSPRTVARLSDPGSTTISEDEGVRVSLSGLAKAGAPAAPAGRRAADLSDPSSEPIADEGVAPISVSPFRAIAEWLAADVAADALRRMDRVDGEPVTAVKELVAVVNARVGRLTVPLESGALELWLRHAAGDARLADIARASSTRGELGAWTFLWAAGEKRLRLGRHAVRSVEELWSEIRTRDEARKSAAAALTDERLRAWLEHAQGREDLVKLVDASRNLEPEIALWALAYNGGLAELDVDEDATVTTLGELAVWLRGHLYAFADRLADEELRARLGFWLSARAPQVSREGLRDAPRTMLHRVLWVAGFKEVWLDDETSVATEHALAERLAASPAYLARATVAGATSAAAARDHAQVLALLAATPTPSSRSCR